MPSEDIDRSALASNLEGGLRNRDPPCAAQEPKDRVHHLGVIAIEESIELLTLPEDTDMEARTQRFEDPLENVERRSAGAPALDP
jgi:hypothetical protein